MLSKFDEKKKNDLNALIASDKLERGLKVGAWPETRDEGDAATYIDARVIFSEWVIFWLIIVK